MKGPILIALFLAAFLCTNGFTRTLIQDPGNPDHVLIGSAAIGDGETAVIPLRIITDEDVDYINIPIAYANSAFRYDSCQFAGHLAEYEIMNAVDRPGASMVTIFGWSNFADSLNPYLNTNGQPEVEAWLYFTALPGMPEDTYPLQITVDSYNGALVFGDPNGLDSWIPQYENGFIQIVSEQGFADSVLVMSDTVIVGEQATVAVKICNDEDVSSFTIPISFNSANFNFIGYQLYGDILEWSAIDVEQTPGTEIIAINGQATGTNPFLNTGGNPEIALELYFSTNPNASAGNYLFEIVSDPIFGPLMFRNFSGDEWVPFSRNGFVDLQMPPSCDMRFNYLWAYGFCQSPSINRQYACRICNYGLQQADNVVLTIAHPPIFTYSSSSPEAVVEDNTMTWNIGSIVPGGSSLVNWWVDIPEGLGNDTVVTIADIMSSTYDLDLLNNHREFVEIVGYSYDPNDKIVDPAGIGTGHFINNNNALMYTVYFENSDSATLPATDILVLDTLDANLDWSSVVIGPMSHPDPCSVWVDQSLGLITCDCDGIMLPPNVNPPEGEGFFSFSISPKWNLETGDAVANRAYIKFDLNDWIPAPHAGPTIVTIDVTKPNSAVLPLDEVMYNPVSFDVSWEGTDHLGSGLAYFDIYMSEDGEPFTEWITRTTSTAATFFPDPDHAYAFYSIATDNLGYRENSPSRPDAMTLILGGCQYAPGDINANGSANGVDIVYAVNYLKGGSAPPINCYPNCSATPNPFYAAGDVNGNCAFNGIDITFFVRYLKLQVPNLLYCIDCPPIAR